MDGSVKHSNKTNFLGFLEINGGTTVVAGLLG